MKQTKESAEAKDAECLMNRRRGIVIEDRQAPKEKEKRKERHQANPFHVAQKDILLTNRECGLN